jgi:hypothetical protein
VSLCSLSDSAVGWMMISCAASVVKQKYAGLFVQPICKAKVQQTTCLDVWGGLVAHIQKCAPDQLTQHAPEAVGQVNIGLQDHPWHGLSKWKKSALAIVEPSCLTAS